MATDRWRKYLFEEVPISSLAFLRMAYGGIMLFSVARFAVKGWIYDLYIMPKFYFPYEGFEWVKPLGDPGMYFLFGFMALSAFMVMIGGFYRFFAWGFFLSFTYVELIDKTNYLNHYYFISIMALMMALLPAHRAASFDVWRNPKLAIKSIPNWMMLAPKLQLGLVYFFAGVAKLNPDWLINAQPLSIWLPAQSHLPVIGPLMTYKITPYLFSWGGAIFDLTVPFFLFYSPTRKFAYLAVIGFHLITGWMFQIGMFPYVMILLTLVFFSPEFHQSIINRINKWFFITRESIDPKPLFRYSPMQKALLGVLVLHFAIQMILPFRYALYDGPLFWTEQGFRFSWRVMLMEKAGTAFFYVTDKATGRKVEEVPANYLTPNQEKMMSTQPDMILQFAKYLGQRWKDQGIDPKVTVESYVTLNGSGSRPFIDPNVDLLEVDPRVDRMNWLSAFEKK